MKIVRTLACLICGVFAPFALVEAAEGSALRDGPVEAQLVSPANSVAVGEAFVVALRLRMDEGWHTYSEEPGEVGLPTSIEWDLPEGLIADKIDWPADKEFLTGDIASRGYEGEVLLPVTLRFTDAFAGSEASQVDIAATASWLACDVECILGQAALEISLPLVDGLAETDESIAAAIAGQDSSTSSGSEGVTGGSLAGGSARGSGWVALLVAGGSAFLGGLILNLMPCVLPVISLKVLGFAQQAGQDARSVRGHGLAFTAGVVLSFLALAGALLLLRAGGAAFGWGFQLQSPPLVAALVLVFVALSLNLLGVFEIGMGLTRVGGKSARLRGHTRSFADGALAAVVASPCTAPFMGAALGFSLSQPPLAALAIFASLGFGLAFPYLVLAMRPSLLRWVPKPGRWMETLKQILAFPLLATAVWLLWVFGLQAGVGAMATLAGSAVLIGLAAWVYGRWSGPAGSRGSRLTSKLVALAFLGVALLPLGRFEAQAGEDSVAASQDSAWEPFSAQRLEASIAEGQPVFVDFTAAWCVTCQWNKRSALDTARVQNAFEEDGTLLMRADWTRQDPEIGRALQTYGRQSVPLYLYFDGGAEPKVLPELLTPEIVVEAVRG